MSNETGITVISPRTLDEAQRLSGLLAKSSLLPDALRGKEAEVLMTIMTGAEIGLAPMQAIRAIDVIKGKPSLKAEAMAALVRSRKDVCEYLIIRESTAERATYATKRVGDPSETVMSFTMKEAQSAGIASDMYKKFPANMLRARCVKNICTAVYSDLTLGLASQEEEEAVKVSTTPLQRVDVEQDFDSTTGEVLSERAKLEEAINGAESVVDLKKLVERLVKIQSKADKDALRAVYSQRLAVLSAPKKQEPVDVVEFHVEPKVEEVPRMREPGEEG